MHLCRQHQKLSCFYKCTNASTISMLAIEVNINPSLNFFLDNRKGRILIMTNYKLSCVIMEGKRVRKHRDG